MAEFVVTVCILIAINFNRFVICVNLLLITWLMMHVLFWKHFDLIPLSWYIVLYIYSLLLSFVCYFDRPCACLLCSSSDAVNIIFYNCLYWSSFSLRRNADELRKSIESVVVPLFSVAQLAGDEEKQIKLTKVSISHLKREN